MWSSCHEHLKSTLRAINDDTTLHLLPRKKRASFCLFFFFKRTSVSLKLIKNRNVSSYLQILCVDEQAKSEMFPWMCRNSSFHATGSTIQTLRRSGHDVTYLLSLQSHAFILDNLGLDSLMKLPLKIMPLQRPEIVKDLCLQHQLQ